MQMHGSGLPNMDDRADHWARRMADASDSVTDAEREEFHTWLAASEENETDFRRAVVLLQLVMSLPPSGQNAVILACGESSFERDRITDRRDSILWFAGLAASAALALVSGGLYLENRGIFGETHSTRTGEVSTVKLNDGSVAYLNSGTRIRWVGSSDDRRVKLLSGEVLFDVAHDEARPFSVILDDSEIRVLGTRFNVDRKDSGAVTVTVLDGVVEVRSFAQSSTRPDWVRLVKRNEQIEYRPIGLVAEPHQTNAMRAVAWVNARPRPARSASAASAKTATILGIAFPKRISWLDTSYVTVTLDRASTAEKVRQELARIRNVSADQVSAQAIDSIEIARPVLKCACAGAIVIESEDPQQDRVISGTQSHEWTWKLTGAKLGDGQRLVLEVFAQQGKEKDQMPIAISKNVVRIDVEFDATRTTVVFLQAHWQWFLGALIFTPLGFLFPQWLKKRQAKKLATDSESVLVTDTSVARELEERKRRARAAAGAGR